MEDFCSARPRLFHGTEKLFVLIIACNHPMRKSGMVEESRSRVQERMLEGREVDIVHAAFFREDLECSTCLIGIAPE